MIYFNIRVTKTYRADLDKEEKEVYLDHLELMVVMVHKDREEHKVLLEVQAKMGALVCQDNMVLKDRKEKVVLQVLVD